MRLTVDKMWYDIGHLYISGWRRTEQNWWMGQLRMTEGNGRVFVLFHLSICISTAIQMAHLLPSA
jgi:hypothetical protein